MIAFEGDAVLISEIVFIQQRKDPDHDADRPHIVAVVLRCDPGNGVNFRFKTEAERKMAASAIITAVNNESKRQCP